MNEQTNREIESKKPYETPVLTELGDIVSKTQRWRK